MQLPAEIFGPLGALFLLALATYRLWQLHERADTKRDAALDSLTATLPGIADSLRTLSKVVEDRLSEADRK